MNKPASPIRSAARGAFRPLIGLKPWNVTLGIGSFLTMEFGKAVVQEFRGKSHTHGEWHLWLQHCAWRIQNGDRILIASDDEHDILARAISRLKLGSLDKVAVSPTLDLSLSFGGTTLSTFSASRYRYEQWKLFRPDGAVLVAGAGGVLMEKDAGGLS